MRARLFRQLAGGAGWGALLALAGFALEAWLLWRGDAAGLQIDQHGPLAALFAAIRPQLPPLLLRVLVVYAAAGAALGCLAALLARAWSPAGGWQHRALWLSQVALMQAALVLGHAVQRPALFDDLPALRAPLAWAVDQGQPWHAWALWALVLGSAAVRALWRARPAPRVWLPGGAGVLGLAALVLLTGVARHRPPPPAQRVVLIGIDAFRPDRLAALGGTRAVAPHLDALAREATVFTRAFTPLAQTEPAWRSLLTARWPSATGVRYPLTPQARWAQLPTFPNTLREAGFKTVFATDCSRFHFEPEASGFEVRLQPPRGAINFALEKLRFRGVGVWADHALGAWALPEFVDNRALAGIHDPEGYARRLAQRMVGELRAGPALFAWHSTAAHFPGDPSYPHYRQFVGADRPLERRLRMQFSPIAGGARAPDGQWGREDSEALYDELLAQSDAQVGVLFDALKAEGLWADTWVIVFSDHGESFHPDQPALAGATPVHGARLREEENRILLLVKPPGGKAVDQVDALVRLVDVGPTILEALGAPALEAADGLSLSGLLRGEPQAPRLLYAETGYTHASPAAFDPQHRSDAPRTFAAYAVRPDGVIEMTEAAHRSVLAEKDVGAFDGTDWLVRSPRADGTVRESCTGNCELLGPFLNQVLQEER